MNTSEIEAMLEKYYEGAASLAEEETLRNFFTGHDVPEHLEHHRLLFAYFNEEKQVRSERRDFVPPQEPAGETGTGEPPVIALAPRRRRLLYLAGMAAAILLLAGLFFTIRTEVRRHEPVVADASSPEHIYADAREALLLVSGNLNHGLSQASRIGEVDRVMKQMQLLNKFYQYESLVINPDELFESSIKSEKP